MNNVPWELIDAVAADCHEKTLARLALVSRAFQGLAERRLYREVTISEANEVNSREHGLLQTLAASPRAGYVQYFLVEFGRYRDSEIDGLDDGDDEDWWYGRKKKSKKDRQKEKEEEEEKDPRFKTWDATDLVLKALENMHSLMDLRVKVRKGSKRLVDELNRIISAGFFKLRVLYCDGRRNLGPLVEAHRRTLEVLVVWMWNGYSTTADLIPYMQRSTREADPYPSLIVAGFEPPDHFYHSEEAMMIFPKYLPVFSEKHGAQTRNVDEALDILKKTFARDKRGRESLRFYHICTVICCVETLPEAGVSTSFTHAIANQCKFVTNFTIYHAKLKGLLDDKLAKSLSSFPHLQTLYMQAWDPKKMKSEWREVPKADIVAFGIQCGEACPTLTTVEALHGPCLAKKGSQWILDDSSLFGSFF
ncbi:hypothetical protein BKA70DRAFT_1233911 [Coprinopsis sp. MPI-PUGE-AT-0042]|nr:hypothetical protein BKA70DRAFT_1233911 [Coprinopsis sp. MPI-PUGE-AT-0042]